MARYKKSGGTVNAARGVFGDYVIEPLSKILVDFYHIFLDLLLVHCVRDVIYCLDHIRIADS